MRKKTKSRFSSFWCCCRLVLVLLLLLLRLLSVEPICWSSSLAASSTTSSSSSSLWCLSKLPDYYNSEWDLTDCLNACQFFFLIFYFLQRLLSKLCESKIQGFSNQKHKRRTKKIPNGRCLHIQNTWNKYKKIQSYGKFQKWKILTKTKRKKRWNKKFHNYLKKLLEKREL